MAEPEATRQQGSADTFEVFRAVVSRGFSSLQEELLAQCKQVFTENEHLREELEQRREGEADVPTPRSVPGETENLGAEFLQHGVAHNIATVEIDCDLGQPAHAPSNGFSGIAHKETNKPMLDDIDPMNYSSWGSAKSSDVGQPTNGNDKHSKTKGHSSRQISKGSSSSHHSHHSPVPPLAPLQWPAGERRERAMRQGEEIETYPLGQDFSPTSTSSNAVDDSRSLPSDWLPPAKKIAGAQLSQGFGEFRQGSYMSTKSGAIVQHTPSALTTLVGQFALHECFTIDDPGMYNDKRPGFTEHQQSIPQHITSFTKRISMTVEVDAEVEHKRDCISKFLIVRPNSFGRLAWDVVGVILIAYDIISVPLQAFTSATYGWQDALTYITTCFWTADIVLSCVTGVYADGLLVLKIKGILRYYLQTWFFPDVAIVILDWADIIITTSLKTQSGSDDFRFGNWTRILRPVLRIFRLVRLAKLIRILRAVIDSMNSEIVLMVLQILRLVLVILIINHYVACAWYGLAMLHEDTDNWVNNHARGRSTAYKYLTSLHWSLTQFTPASMEIFPTNDMERLFNLCILIFGLITFSSFVSSITSAMSRLASIRGDRQREESQLRNFLSQRKVSSALGTQIRRFFRENYEVRKNRVEEIDIAFFTELPIKLRVALHAEIYVPVMSAHPLFKSYAGINSESMSSICHFATVQRREQIGKNVFLTGESGRDMLYVLSGELRYHHTSSKIPHGCTEGQWLAEGVLWGVWYHRGRLTADSESELVGICAETFRSISSERLSSFTYLKSYARLFQIHLNMRSEMGEPFTDLPFSIDVVQDMVHQIFQKIPSKKRRKHMNPLEALSG